ncbi:hypothetical protein DL766_003067 [Monosporascus sp. MC13-8B]|uniref:PARP-type domain-containing protein n=1 Tax=Monosporascus cannonballus TaxID=155416 RepID=A0ABY0HA81_9PEZI|nr:hypothetical protein DL762_003774 [Monosporascus cannonballus]RYP34292.1 hypothetical protein DL766_003067 [Monosporascus sp. MC13-8B]
MSYRIELSKNNRAGCQDGVCKNAAAKIAKGELRLGAWVTMPGGEHGSWRWRHWGCVSGFTISNIQESIKNADGDYDWNMLDGYDELDDHPDVQEKIRRVVTQGHIDPEDFNGDPEFNKPGQKAIRGRAKKPKAKDDDAAEEDDAPKKKPAKRGRKKAAEDDDDEEEARPAKKKARDGRKSKSAVGDDDDEEVQPQLSKTKAKGGRKSKAAAEEDEDEPQGVAPVKKPRGRKAVKKAPAPSADDDDEVETEEEEADEPEYEPEPEPEPAPNAKGRRGRKSTKTAAVDEGDNDTAVDPAPTKSRRGRPKKA